MPKRGTGFTLTVNEAPSFVSPDSITCIEVTANCDFDVSARGYPPPVLTQSGTLPSLLDGLAGANTTYSIFGVADAGTRRQLSACVHCKQWCRPCYHP